MNIPRLVPIQVRVLADAAPSEIDADLKGLDVPGIAIEIRCTRTEPGKGPLDRMPPFIRLTNGEAFMALAPGGDFLDPNQVLHYTTNPAESDALGLWLLPRWGSAIPA